MWSTAAVRYSSWSDLWSNVFVRFVGKLEIFLDAHMIFDFEEDQWKGNDETTAEECPAGSEDVNVRCLVAVDCKDY